MSINTVRRVPAFLALSCVGAFTSGAAIAGPREDRTVPANDAEDQTRDVVVTGTKDVPQGPKQVAPLVNTPRSVVVLPRQVIEETGANSLADALRTVPGITFGAAEGGNPIGDRPFIRGFDSQGSTFVDGVHDFASQTREVFAVERIEIVRGSDSTLGGRGSAGGAINIVSKQPENKDFGRITASYGNADYKRVTADLNEKLTDTIAFRIEGVWHDQSVAGRDAIWNNRWGIAPALTIGLGAATRLTLGYYRLESHELPDSGIPYLYTIGNAPGTGTIYSQPAIGRITTISGQTGVVSRSTFYGVAARDFRDTSVDQGTVRLEHDLGKLTLRDTLRATHDVQAYIYTQPDDSQGDVYGTNAANPATAGGLVWRRPNTRYGYADSWVNQVDIYGDVLTGGVKHSLSAGIELAWERARRGTYVSRGVVSSTGAEVLGAGYGSTPRCTPLQLSRFNCTSLFAPNPADPWVNYSSDTAAGSPAPIVRALKSEETESKGWTQSAYAFDSITLTPALIANLGARVDRFTSSVTPGQLYGVTQSFTLRRRDTLFNWQAGLVYKPGTSTSIYASYATSATPPNSLLGEGSDTNVLGTTTSAAALLDALKVEKTRSYEVGAKANALGGRLALNAAVFQTVTDNARVTGPDGNPQFVGKRQVRGVELGVSGTIREGWSVFGGYTHLDARILDGGMTALIAAAVPGRAAQTVLVPSVNTGKPAPQTAGDSATLWTTLQATHRLSLSGGAFYTGRQFGGYADNRTAVQDGSGVVTVTPATKILYRTIPDYVRLDARIAYKLTRAVQLSVNAQNLTDKTYFTQAYASHYATIAPGRTVFGTIELAF